jgi:hypothetical protein
MADYKAELDDAVINLDRHFEELKRAAVGRRGPLFNPADYPATLVGLFGVSRDYPTSSRRATSSASPPSSTGRSRSG